MSADTQNRMPNVICRGGRSIAWILALSFSLTSAHPAQDASRDTTFDPETGISRLPIVRGCSVQTGNSLLLYGDFTQANGMPSAPILRLAGDTIDPSFSVNRPSATPGRFEYPYLTGDIRAVASYLNDQVLVAGNTYVVLDQYSHGFSSLAMLNSNGTIDTFFRPQIFGTVTAVAVQPDGKILVGGYHLGVVGQTDATYCLLRLESSGQKDSTYEGISNSLGLVNQIQVYSVATNRFHARVTGSVPLPSNPETNQVVIWLDDTGRITHHRDLRAGTGLDSAIDSQGRLLLAATYISMEGGRQQGLLCYRSDGSLDPTFTPGAGPNQELATLALDAQDRIYIGGSFTAYDGQPCGRVLRLKTDGTRDDEFHPDPGVSDRVFEVQALANGSVRIAGVFGAINNMPCPGLAVLDSQGKTVAAYPAISLAHTTKAKVLALALQKHDDKILVGGSFTGYRGVYCPNLARLNPDGTPDPSFEIGSGFDGSEVRHLSIDQDRFIMASGNFGVVQGCRATSLARLNPAGAFDATFRPVIQKFDGSLAELKQTLILPDRKIIVLGHLRRINGVSRDYVARLHTDGTLDTEYLAELSIKATNNLPPYGPIPVSSPIPYTCARQPDGKLLIGGSVVYDNLSRGFLLRLDPNGLMDPSFQPTTLATNVLILNGTVKKVHILADGKILVGGGFGEIIDGSFWSRPRRVGLARFDPNGGLDSAFDPEMGAENSGVECFDIQPDGKILIGGSFRRYNQPNIQDPHNALRLARVLTNGLQDLTFITTNAADSTVYALAWGDDRAYFGGEFSSYQGTKMPGIGRLVAHSVPQDQDSTYPHWVDMYFTALDPSHDKLEHADPDHDGLINVLEYAFASHPRQPDSRILPKHQIVSQEGQSYLAFTFRRPLITPSDLIYDLTFSPAVLPWTGDASGLQMDPPIPAGDHLEVTCRIAVPLHSPSQGFLQLVLIKKNN